MKYLYEVISLDRKPRGAISVTTRDRAFHLIQNLIAELRLAGSPTVEPPYEDLLRVVQAIRGEIEDLPEPLVSWTLISRANEYEYVHPYDVAVFSIATALLMGNGTRINDVGVGAFLHDIGMALIRIPSTYLEGEGLSEDDIPLYRSHPELGVRVLRQHPRISAFVKAIVSQHHERMDGTGFPRGFRGSDIHLYSRIVACADVYSRLLFKSYLDKTISPAEVVEYMMSLAGFELDKEVVRVMLSCVAPFPEGATVKLSTGEMAVVSQLPAGLLTRPVLRVVRAEGESLVETQEEIDLRQPEHQTTLIVGIV